MHVAEGARFVSVRFPLGVSIGSGRGDDDSDDEESGSLTMEKCTATCQEIVVRAGASLVMEDCCVFDCTGRGAARPSSHFVDFDEGTIPMERTIRPTEGNGLRYEGKREATRCTFERNRKAGVYVSGGSANLVECVVRNNGEHGMNVGNGMIPQYASRWQGQHDPWSGLGAGPYPGSLRCLGAASMCERSSQVHKLAKSAHKSAGKCQKSDIWRVFRLKHNKVIFDVLCAWLKERIIMPHVSRVWSL